MSYCAVTDVQAQMSGRKLVFSDLPATFPSLTQVNGFIDQTSNEIDQTILRAGFKTPLTSNPYLVLTNALGAAYLVEMSLCIDGTPESMNILKMRKDAYDQRIASIKENPRLAGAVPADGGQNPQIMSDGTSNYSVNSNADVPFTRDGWNW